MAVIGWNVSRKRFVSRVVSANARKKKAERYAELVRAAGGHPGEDEATFQTQYKEFLRQLELTGTREAELQNA